jgi:hypothetical protein
MSYDDWKLMTPPGYKEELERCDMCTDEFFSKDIYSHFVNLVPHKLCLDCYDKLTKNYDHMTTKERFKAIKNLIDSNMIPERCEARLWINNCTKKELLDLGAELEILCEKRSDNNPKIHLYVEYKGHDIYLWE